MIPKILHYCWFGPNKMPKTVRRCIATWRKHLPDYEFRLWNESNSPMSHPFVQSAYQAKRYAFVADYVRFWALYNYGGIYLDTDMYVLRSFNDLLESNFFCAYEQPCSQGQSHEGGTLSCGALGACALGACAKAVLDKYDTLRYEEPKRAEFVIPRLITPILAHFQDQMTIYPYDYFYPFPYTHRYEHNFMDYRTPNTYAIHLWDLSWVSKTDKAVNYCVVQLKKLLRWLHFYN